MTNESMTKKAENLKKAHLVEGVVNPTSKQEESSIESTQAIRGPDAKDPTISLMESIVERSNLLKALQRVENNKGAPGTDGMTTTELRSYCHKHWVEIRSGLLDNTYKPSPVRRVEIPKANGE
ncbi:MAG: hypothetical protein KA436_04805, partial [Oligoflexales bacterium]|nr:hypothetical protein [Oligoflexales bacterium]